MSLIRKPHELKIKVFPQILVYGQPGSGKSTLALSAPDPLFLDFDKGVHRVNTKHQADTVQIESWQNVLDVLANEDLSAYKTLVIDTAGKMLDFMGVWLIQNNPKLGKGSGALTLQGYGERKAEFRAFLKRVQLMGKNLVFVAHDMEERDGDQRIIRPEIGGSSGADLVKELDLVGYMEMIGNQRTISFDPCEKFYGKNTCGMPQRINLPDVVNGGAKNNFLTTVFEEFQNKLEERKRTGELYLELMDVITAKVESIEDAELANEVAEWASQFKEHIWDSKLQLRVRFGAKVKALGLGYNKATGKYFTEPSTTTGTAPEVPNPVPEPAAPTETPAEASTVPSTEAAQEPEKKASKKKEAAHDNV